LGRIQTNAHQFTADQGGSKPRREDELSLMRESRLSGMGEGLKYIVRRKGEKPARRNNFVKGA
jgi:hypothetical protein